MEVRALAALLLTIGLTTVPVVGGLPTPGQDDAGSGGDAGDHPALAVPVDAGTYEGMLAGQTDVDDYYEIDPPATSLIQLSVDAEAEVVVELVDPEGNVREFGSTTPALEGPGFEGEAIGAPKGEWQLHVLLPDDTRLDQDIPYRFELGYEIHDNVAHVDRSAENASAITAPFRTDRFKAVEVAVDADEPIDAHEPVAVPYAALVRATFENGTFAFGSAGLNRVYRGVNDEVVWAKGRGPMDVGIETPELPTGSSRLLEDTILFDNGTVPAPGLSLDFRVWLGLGSSHGVDAQAWVLWDDPVEGQASFMEPPETTYRSLDDCDGGQGAQVGPYVRADNLTCTFEVTTEFSLYAVDGSSPQFATESAEVAVTDPTGETTELRGDDIFRAFEKEDEPGEPIPQGAWTVDVEHVDGLEHGRHRVVAASFPFPNPFVG